MQQVCHFLDVNLLVLRSGDPTLLTERDRHGVPAQVAAELGSVVQKLNEERARRRAAEQQVRNTEEQLRRVLASNSWKVMQPLRRVRAFLGPLPPKLAPGRIVP